MRKFQFQTGEYYHVYNRGTDKRDVFMDKNDYARFLLSMKEFNTVTPVGSLRQIELNRGLAPAGAKPLLSSPLVNILAYCLNKNHYHLLIKQTVGKGLSEFMKRVGGGYTCYFNSRYSRSGALFQGTFKSAPVVSTDHLLHLSCYINGNPEIHKITKADSYQWSSYRDYLSKQTNTLCDKEEIIKILKNKTKYENLVNIVIRESSRKKEEAKKTARLRKNFGQPRQVWASKTNIKL